MTDEDAVKLLEDDDLSATSDDEAYRGLRDAALMFALMAKTLKDRQHAGFANVEPVQLLGILDGILEAHYGTAALPSREVH